MASSISRRLPPETKKKVLTLYRRSLKMVFSNNGDRDVTINEVIPRVREFFSNWPTVGPKGFERDMTLTEFEKHLDETDDYMKRVLLSGSMLYTSEYFIYLSPSLNNSSSSLHQNLLLPFSLAKILKILLCLVMFMKDMQKIIHG
jgi:hypothetical protein